MAVPQGFKLVQQPSNIPAGFKPVDEGLGVGGALLGGANLLAAGVAGAGEQALGGLSQLGGVIAGRGPGQAIQSAEALTAAIPDVPLGEDAQALITNLSERFQTAPDIVKQIVASAQGLPEAAGEIGRAIGEPIGLGATLGAAASAVPAALEAATGLGAARRVPGAIATAAQAVEPLTDVATAVFKRQSPTKQRIARLIQEGSTDVETARFKLTEPQAAPTGAAEPRVSLTGATDVPLLEGPSVQPTRLEAGAAEIPLREGPAVKPTKLDEFLNIGGPRVTKDRSAIEAIRQGFDEGVIAAVKGSTPQDRLSMRKMVNIMERGKKNARFAVTNRPSDVVGDSLMSRIKVVQGINTAAGRRLDGVAKSLKGQQIDFEPAINGFINDLNGMGINVTDDLKLNFSGSDIEGLAGPERAITQVFNRMKNTKPPDAFDLHRMKRFIDEQVTFGKNAEGLAGRSEVVLKKLRRSLDQTLDSNFPEYDKVNTQYSETIGALDAIQDVAGRKMDLTGPNAEKATGTLMRRLMSNAQSRITLLDSINQIEGVAKKFGGKFKDDLLSQVLFVDELDSVFGPVARTSFQGQIEQGVRSAISPASAAIDLAAKTAEKARGINEAGAFKAIKQLLRQSK